MKSSRAAEKATARELRGAFDVGATVWPNVQLELAEFSKYVERHAIKTDAATEILQDVFLACACGRGDPDALNCFRVRYLSVVRAAVRTFDNSPEFADEVYQRLSEALFVAGAGGEPKIRQYKGQGPLAGFVRTSARRIGMRLAARAARFQGEDALVHQFSRGRELDATLLEAQCAEVINRALRIALRQLPRRERLILRMNLVERISTTRIAGMYRVSQPTVSRWIQRSARSIQSTVKDLVCDELDVNTRELESLLALVRSQIEITISHGSTLGTIRSS